MKFIYIPTVIGLLFAFQACSNSDNTAIKPGQEDNVATLPGDELHEDDDHHDEDHELYRVEKKPFSLVYKTSGIIMVDTKDIIAITAKSPGIVRYEDHFLFPGVKVQSGTSLFSITGDNLTENNTSVNYTMVEADYLEAKLNLERAKKLIDEKLITQENYLSFEKDFNKAKAEYEAFGSVSGREGSIVKAPAVGYIQEVYISEGAIVKPGDMLAKMIIKHNMVLKAEVAPSDRNIIEEITGANFKPGYSKKIYSLDELNGSQVSFGISTGENSFYLPLFFRIDYTDDLIPGTYADVWLLGQERPDVLIIPNSSILEEYGKYYVFVETEEEVFEKRYFTMGQSDGSFTEVLSGLEEGEEIVSEGAYQVKMSMSSSIPSAQNHNH